MSTYSSSSTTDPRWIVFDYEVMMFRSMCALLANGNVEYAKLSESLRNAVTECAILHTRQLADILMSRGKLPDDINLKELLPEFKPKGLDALCHHYGDHRTANTPCWTINKYLAHATSRRGDNFDYTDLLNGLVPLVEVVLDEILTQRS